MQLCCLLVWSRYIELLAYKTCHEVFNGSWQVLQTVDGWLGGSGKAQSAPELRSDKYLCLYRKISRENVKTKHPILWGFETC